jgi:hypothetical protein
MSTYSPSPQLPANTHQQLAGQLFQVPAQPEPAPVQQQWSPQVTLSGGVVPGAPAQPSPTVPVSPGFQSPQIPAPINYPAPVQTAPAFPAAPAPVTPAPAPPVQSRSILDSLVQQSQLTPQEAAAYRSDQELFVDMLAMLNARQEPAAAPATPTPPAPTTPAPAAGPSPDELNRQVMALQQSGALEFTNGRFVSKYPDFQSIAEKANQERMRAEQHLQELNNPQQWLRKHGEAVFDERLQPLQQKIDQLQSMLVEAMPKPHEAWVEQNKSLLYLPDPTTGSLTNTLSPAGAVYQQTYNAAAASGIDDLRALHNIAATAAQNMFQFVSQPQPQQATPPQAQQSFWQAAGAAAPPAPGFTAPGSVMSRQQPQQTPIPVTNQGQVDFQALAAGIMNGSIPRI